MDFTETLVSHMLAYDGLITKTNLDKVSLPNGEESLREIIDHPGGVAIVPVDSEGMVYCVRQFRYAMGKHLLEIPAGKLEKNEEPMQCAVRELSEETGITAGRLTDLGYNYPSPGFCREVLHIYLATELTFGTAHPDHNEFLEIKKLPLDGLADMVMKNELTDAKTIIGILKAKMYFDREKQGE